MRITIAVLVWVSISSICDAQLFRRRQVPAQQYSRQSYGHWSFPGRIEDHLSGFHGQNISGLSYSQMLDLHDAIHEGRSFPRKNTPCQRPLQEIYHRPPVQERPKSWAPSV